MKKLSAIILTLCCCLCLGLSACGGADGSDVKPPFSPDTQQSSGSSDTGSSDTGSSSSSSSSSSGSNGTWTDDYPVTPVPGK